MSGKRTGRFIGVREAARRLDVHENTIRKWVAEGKLIDARLPGTQFIRIDVQQIEPMIAERQTYEGNTD